MSEETCNTALRTVLACEEINELTHLRQENKLLRAEVEELRHWKGRTELPTIGKYYEIDQKTVNEYGWNLGEETVYRYDGAKDKTVTLPDGTTTTIILHVFTAPHRYEADAYWGGLGKTGWVQLELKTHDLHQTLDVEWDDGDTYLDQNDEPVEWRSPE